MPTELLVDANAPIKAVHNRNVGLALRSHRPTLGELKTKRDKVAFHGEAEITDMEIPIMACSRGGAVHRRVATTHVGVLGHLGQHANVKAKVRVIRPNAIANGLHPAVNEAKVLDAAIQEIAQPHGTGRMRLALMHHGRARRCWRHRSDWGSHSDWNRRSIGNLRGDLIRHGQLTTTKLGD